MTNNIEEYLFKTNAIRFCEENKPFWYTSGKIGPYFINTHFVYGSEESANDLLSFIDNALSNKDTLPKKVFEKSFTQYKENEIYKAVIDSMILKIKENIDLNNIDYISAGERRDWFFSNVIAHLLKKPHISIYKDLSVKIHSHDFETALDQTDVKNKNVLHIADLVTIASSYVRAWIPAINNLGGKINWSVVVVDRMQGGTQIISDNGITPYSLVNVDKQLFQKALDMSLITTTQQTLLNDFYKEPDESMKQFLLSHKEFISNSLNSDEKTKKRAQLLIDSDVYGINELMK